MSFLVTSSRQTKRHTQEGLQERDAVSGGKRSRMDLPSSLKMQALEIQKGIQTTSPQIVPQNQANDEQVSREQLEAMPNIATLQTVPGELDDFMDFNGPFHLQDRPFPGCSVLEDNKKFVSEKGCLKASDISTAEDPHLNQAYVNQDLESSGTIQII